MNNKEVIKKYYNMAVLQDTGNWPNYVPNYKRLLEVIQELNVKGYKSSNTVEKTIAGAIHNLRKHNMNKRHVKSFSRYISEVARGLTWYVGYNKLDDIGTMACRDKGRELRNKDKM